MEVDEKKLMDQINNAFKTLEELDSKIKESANKADIESVKKELDEIKDNVSTLEFIDDEKSIKLTDHITELKDHGNNLEVRLKEMETSKAYQAEKDADQIIKLCTDPEFIAAIKAGNRTFENGFELKAAITTSSFTAGSGAVAMDQLHIPGIEKHPWRTNPVFAAIPKQMVGEKVNSITWYNENTRTDNAGAVAEGGTPSESSTTLQRVIESFYKVSHYSTVTEETLEDSDLMSGEINDLLKQGVAQERERQLLDGDGSGSNEITGIINDTAQVAKDFAAPSGLRIVTSPNEFDCLRAAKLQVRIGIGSTDTKKKGYNANIALVNPVDLANLDLEKDANGNYVLPPFWDISGNKVSGMMLLESDYIAAGKFLVGDFNKAKIFIKRGIRLDTSRNVASNFLVDKEVVKATMRMALKITSFGAFAFVYGDFGTAKADLSA